MPKIVNDQSEIATVIVRSMREHGIDPDAKFTAAAGHDYGHVEAYRLPDGVGYAIEYASNGETNYAICDDADDLAGWLESPDLSGIDATIQTANVRGADAIPGADESDKGPLYVLATRYWYGPAETSGVERDDKEVPRDFATAAEAQEWIDSKDAGTYFLSHNESGRPAYKIIKV